MLGYYNEAPFDEDYYYAICQWVRAGMPVREMPRLPYRFTSSHAEDYIKRAKIECGIVDPAPPPPKDWLQIAATIEAENEAYKAKMQAMEDRRMRKFQRGPFSGRHARHDRLKTPKVEDVDIKPLPGPSTSKPMGPRASEKVWNDVPQPEHEQHAPDAFGDRQTRPSNGNPSKKKTVTGPNGIIRVRVSKPEHSDRYRPPPVAKTDVAKLFTSDYDKLDADARRKLFKQKEKALAKGGKTPKAPTKPVIQDESEQEESVGSSRTSTTSTRRRARSETSEDSSSSDEDVMDNISKRQRKTTRESDEEEDDSLVRPSSSRRPTIKKIQKPRPSKKDVMDNIRSSKTNPVKVEEGLMSYIKKIRHRLQKSDDEEEDQPTEPQRPKDIMNNNRSVKKRSFEKKERSVIVKREIGGVIVKEELVERPNQLQPLIEFMRLPGAITAHQSDFLNPPVLKCYWKDTTELTKQVFTRMKMLIQMALIDADKSGAHTLFLFEEPLHCLDVKLLETTGTVLCKLDEYYRPHHLPRVLRDIPTKMGRTIQNIFITLTHNALFNLDMKESNDDNDSDSNDVHNEVSLDDVFKHLPRIIRNLVERFEVDQVVVLIPPAVKQAELLQKMTNRFLEAFREDKFLKQHVFFGDFHTFIMNNDLKPTPEALQYFLTNYIDLYSRQKA